MSTVITGQRYLRPLYSSEVLTVKAVDGSRTIARAPKVFAMIHFDFGDLGLDFSSPPTPEMELSIHEVSRNGKSVQVLADFPNLNDLCLTQDQIIQTSCDHSGKFHPRGNTYFFFTKKGEKINNNLSNLFVARILHLTSGLYIFPDHFSYADRWRESSKSRLITPKLGL